MKVIAIVCATLFVCWLLAEVIGPRVGSVAFHLPFLGWAITWSVCIFLAVGFVFWRAVKG